MVNYIRQIGSDDDPMRDARKRREVKRRRKFKERREEREIIFSKIRNSCAINHLIDNYISCLNI